MKRYHWINLGLGLTLMLLMFASLWLRGHGQVVLEWVHQVREAWPSLRPVMGVSAVYAGIVIVLTWDDDDSDL